MAVVSYSSTQDIRTMMYGLPTQQTLNYLQGQMANLQQLSATFGNAATQFVDRARQMYEKFNGEDALRKARAALNKLDTIWQQDIVYEMTTVGQMQQAKPVMQRWIMAQPDLRKLYMQQRCYGYADSYVDYDPGNVGRDHYDWRRVMNGMAVVDEDGDTRISIFMDEHRKDDMPLSHDDKVRIQTCWDFAKHFLEIGDDDFTNPRGGKF